MLEFEFPDTGEGVTEGTFLEWLVDEGDEVEEDQAVAEVETDKAVVDVPAPTSGTIEELKAEPGDTVEVGDVILVMDDGSGTGQDEKEEEEESEPEESGEEQEEVEEKDDAEVESSTDASENILALPKVRKLAEEKGVNLADIKTGERITEEEVKEAAGETGQAGEDQESSEESETTGSTESSEDVKATPAVRKLAREKGVNIQQVEGSGREGKITREDVLSATETGTGKKEEPEEEERTDSREVAETEEGERVELSNVRKTIAERMQESKFTAPHVTHVDTADVTELVELRNEKKEKVDEKLTYMPFIMKAAVLALKEYPDLNAELDEESDEIVRYDSYDFNIAVDTDEGLMVPVVRNVDEASILELADDVVEKAGKARDGDLSKSDLENGTFSITNVGVIGGQAFTPIINYPQVAILGVGKIEETAEVVDGEVEPRMTVTLSLSYDHRVVDGATAAKFMNAIIENLEDPEKMLMAL